MLETEKEQIRVGFRKYLLEMAGKDALPIEWHKNSKIWLGKFYIDDNKFDIRIESSDRYCKNVDVWEFEFTRNNSTKMKNDFKYPYVVVPTIKKAMEDFLKEKKPSVLGFVGNKDDKGRVKMYEKNSKYYSDKFDYKLFLDKSTEYYAYVLYADDKFEECAEEMISDKF